MGLKNGMHTGPSFVGARVVLYRQPMLAASHFPKGAKELYNTPLPRFAVLSPQGGQKIRWGFPKRHLEMTTLF